MEQTSSPLEDMFGKAATEAAAMLRLLANEHRLVVLWALVTDGEADVGQLARRAGLSQPAMSQHLSRLRSEGLVATRPSGTRIQYRVTDTRVPALIAFLQGLFRAAARD